MKSLLRRNLLLLMLGATAAAYTISLESPAFAKNGSDDSSSSSGSGGSGSSGSDSNGGDDNSGSGGGGDDSSGPGSHHGSDDDNSSGDGSSDDGDDRNDDSDDRSANSDDRRGGANNAVRPRIQISVDAATKAGLLSGALVAVDNLGRPLEVEAEIRNGQSVLIAKPHGGDAKRNPGPIASFEVVPAAQAPVHQ